eukprot:Unigene1537_Nuclearia_a/m.4782 Unigene1537_Nuclearia_a/g.4782  ORF Unigene1537_Nuclearia_a/g.4782 Unigene1537_Nuclearia_a/m.4782 type:complete len:602 (-) Unigene1537_Nuclearia_a:107-1912(-)
MPALRGSLVLQLDMDMETNPDLPLPVAPGAAGEEQFSSVQLLTELFQHEAQRSALRAFAANDFAEENVAFVEEVLEMKQLNDGPRVRDLYAEYIRNGSPLQVNIEGNTRAEITRRIVDDKYNGTDVFDAALREILLLLATNTFPKFRAEINKRAQIVSQSLPSGVRRVVILGGGFTGSWVAHVLAAMPRFAVTLVDSKTYFEYTPGMIAALCDPTVSESYRLAYSDIAPQARIITGTCTQVNDRHVLVDGERVPYDYLVISTGSSYTSQIKGRNVSTSYRSKKILSEYADLLSAKRVLVIGGGLVGVELASEIKTRFADKHVILVDANGTVLKRMLPKVQKIALDSLRSRGVEVMLNKRVTSFDLFNKVFITEHGERIACDKVYLATGPRPNTVFLRSNHRAWLSPEGLVKVNKKLQVEGTQNVFAGGDVADLPVEKLAMAAIQHGVTIARNICRLEKDMPPYNSGEKGTMKLANPPKAMIVSLANEAITVLWGKLVYKSKAWLDFKIRYEHQVIQMFVGRVKPHADFGRFPSVLQRHKTLGRPKSLQSLGSSETADTSSKGSSSDKADDTPTPSPSPSKIFSTEASQDDVLALAATHTEL